MKQCLYFHHRNNTPHARAELRREHHPHADGAARAPRRRRRRHGRHRRGDRGHRGHGRQGHLGAAGRQAAGHLYSIIPTYLSSNI